jgi:hypothetical protein
MTEDDFAYYINEIWSHDKYYGFNELFDTSNGDWSEFDFSFLFKVAEKASKLTTIDPNSKLAWFVLEGKQKELTDFYKSAKSIIQTRSRALEAFYSRDEALEWLKK